MVKASEPTSLREAIRFLESAILPIASSTVVSTAKAIGHTLAEPVHAPVSLPRFDNSAMDGFAVRCSDLNSAQVTCLRLSQTVAAGAVPAADLGLGTAARVTTGAAVPRGASGVIMHEHVELACDMILIPPHLSGKDNIRRAGEDIKMGSQILSRATTLHPGHIALLMALGVPSVTVLTKPKVGVISSGNELVEGQGARTGADF